MICSRTIGSLASPAEFAANSGKFQYFSQCQQVKKKMCAFLALERQKPGFPLQFLSPCGACGISAAIPGAPRADCGP
jgi:hypothetical protein